MHCVLYCDFKIEGFRVLEQNDIRMIIKEIFDNQAVIFIGCLGVECEIELDKVQLTHSKGDHPYQSKEMKFNLSSTRWL